MAAGLLFCMVFFVSAVFCHYLNEETLPLIHTTADHHVLRSRMRLYQPHRLMQQIESGHFFRLLLLVIQYADLALSL
jgi:hypothetical protein